MQQTGATLSADAPTSADPPTICLPNEYCNLNPGASCSEVEKKLNPKALWQEAGVETPTSADPPTICLPHEYFKISPDMWEAVMKVCGSGCLVQG